MGLRDTLARLAVTRVRVLTVEVAGHWVTRCALEREMSARGWRRALCAADADVLAVCGPPGPEMSTVVEQIWRQLPGPRARVDIRDAAHAARELDSAAATLLDIAGQRVDARDRPRHPEPAPDSEDGEAGDGDGDGEADMDHDSDHSGMDHGDMDGDMDMAPEGIPLAQGGEDRDGLEMDTLHLRLGPVLSFWPAALVLRCSLHGDVIAEAQAWIVDAAGPVGDWTAGRSATGSVAAARECDHIHDLLALAGWARGAVLARRCRDLLLAGDDRGALPLLERLQRSVRRSGVLRWSLCGVGPLTERELDRCQLPAGLSGDAYDRLLERLRIASGLASKSLRDSPLPGGAVVEALPDLVAGLDIAAARLTVAGLGIETSLRAGVGTA
ncbi:hypothetical protein Mycch_3388 [Mycolicibacterium chubuense NBB4]|uniref:Uncharacterized protein n=1 Tax=Mycolicibacterium chubuense (strain NBB4) TaxID=710421 RepID=I4BLH1_MYCCN|nr:hypothetical protein Mycch_3388 [Mycolicibacterium chubuense NBB4]